jgi:hypothetical protein
MLILLKKALAGGCGRLGGSMRGAKSITIVSSESCLPDVVPRNGRWMTCTEVFVT